MAVQVQGIASAVGAPTSTPLSSSASFSGNAGLVQAPILLPKLKLRMPLARRASLEEADSFGVAAKKSSTLTLTTNAVATWKSIDFRKNAYCGDLSSRMLSAKCASAIHNRPVGSEQMLVFVPPHPLVKHFVSILRNEITPPAMFRGAMAELGRVLIYEASRDWLVTVSGDVQTPCGIASVEFIDPRAPVKVVPILRAGLVLLEQIASVLPATQTYHLGYVRDEMTLQPKLYLNKLPDLFPENSRVLVADPMLATGGTIVAAIDELISRGVNYKLIRVIAAVAAPPALEKLSQKFPGLHVYVGMIDESLNEKGFIVPGLGDAGDRSFGT